MDQSTRKAQLNDSAGIAAVLRSVEYFTHLQEEPLDVTVERVRAALVACLGDECQSVYVFENSTGLISGYVSVHWISFQFLPGPEGYVSELFVLAGARGQGVGKKLLARVKEEGRQRGASRLSLLNLRTRPSYLRGFYSKDGWVERPEAANFIFRFDE
jgi:GNAT superfamily N-acetyltransferase